MRSAIWLALLLLGGLSMLSSSASVEDLAWLAGCWESVGSDAGSGEHWMAPAGGTMLGVNRTVKDGDTVAFEFLRIRETEGGSIEYIAAPSNQAETVFVLSRLTDNEAIFENPDHDFPQRIIYHLKDDGLLDARIEGDVDGETKVIHFPMKRSDC